MVSVIACQTACFNTQPPEGGWLLNGFLIHPSACFNTQPPEGGWAEHFAHFECAVIVSTHSRLKAAGCLCRINTPSLWRFNTQPPEGGWRPHFVRQVGDAVSTHSRLKAAGLLPADINIPNIVSTHSRLKAAGVKKQFGRAANGLFQHTAA